MKLIRQKEVTEMTGVSRASVYKLMAVGRFPKSVSLGERAVAWVESEVQEWILERIAERDEQQSGYASSSSSDSIVC
ncbi:helix-turn-helix transcriptional regulator [Vibrio harveyi]|uniref:helix-turn-helix transcriptional regulator n=1 Tax=Vibrio TaxID=662 RepID=UPI000D644C17|nr:MULTISPECIES: AlpA family transcriptional regulator [Vibrio]EKA7363829.1 AlpA family transcriptional regulator [Vibrio parahaemolyticus]NVC26293.1 AlpA family transcriptional regulator [Vibrio parahaemolyticus]PWF70234.1 transcriptional regulator [Vibrio sp. T9]